MLYAFPCLYDGISEVPHNKKKHNAPIIKQLELQLCLIADAKVQTLSESAKKSLLGSIAFTLKGL